MSDPAPLASLARWNRRAAWAVASLLVAYLACMAWWPASPPPAVASFTGAVESLMVAFMFAHGFVGLAIHGPWPAGSAARRSLPALGAAALTTALLALPAWGPPPKPLVAAAWATLIAHAAVGAWLAAGRQTAWRAGRRRGVRAASALVLSALMGGLAWIAFG